MPRVVDATTAAAWAADRAIAVWAVHDEDVTSIGANELAAAMARPVADGASIALIGRREMGSALAPLASWSVDAEAPPSPDGILRIAMASGVRDVRRIGVLAASSAAIDAGHRAGAGAIVGVRTAGVEVRSLVEAAPDRVVRLDELAALDRERYGTERALRPLALLNPGPAVTSDRVHRAIAGPDACHREPEIDELLGGLRAGLRRVAGVGDDWAVVLLAGSGTAAMEAMVAGSVRSGRRLLVCRNGVYGNRLAEIGRRLGIRVTEVRAPHVEPIDPRAVAVALEADSTIDAVAVVHHETTTGLLNPVHEIAAASDRFGVPVLVDAISSFGVEVLHAGDGIEWIAGTANKCLHGLPGIAFVLASQRAVERVREVPPRSLYLDLRTYLDAEARGTVPFTPAIPAVFALNAALEELGELGLEVRRADYLARMRRLDAGLARLGLEPVVPSEHRSASIRCLPLPGGVAYTELHDELKARGYVIYAGLGEASLTTFRICALGELAPAAMDGVVAALGDVLGQPTGIAAS